MDEYPGPCSAAGRYDLYFCLNILSKGAIMKSVPRTVPVFALFVLLTATLLAKNEQRTLAGPAG